MFKCKVLSYFGTKNIGDAIQTVAVSQFLNYTTGVYRHDMHNYKSKDFFIINGWIGDNDFQKSILPLNKNVYYCGVHAAGNHFDKITYQNVIGARDWSTHKKLIKSNLRSEFLGCPTLFFNEYKNERKGIYSVDYTDGPGVHLTHWIDKFSWEQQWKVAIDLLEIYKKAKEVHTTRLHVILPCLAFGTPVFFYRNTIDPDGTYRILNNDERFTILDQINESKSGDQIILDRKYIVYLEENYKNFIKSITKQNVVKSFPKFPKVYKLCL